MIEKTPNEFTTTSLPKNVSSDGREIWDWAFKLCQLSLKEDKIKNLRTKIRECGSRCGDCAKWMIKSQCPKEKPGKGKRSGYSVGPSCNVTKCQKYVESIVVTKRRADLVCSLESIMTSDNITNKEK